PPSPIGAPNHAPARFQGEGPPLSPPSSFILHAREADGFRGQIPEQRPFGPLSPLQSNPDPLGGHPHDPQSHAEQNEGGQSRDGNVRNDVHPPQRFRLPQQQHRLGGQQPCQGQQNKQDAPDAEPVKTGTDQPSDNIISEDVQRKRQDDGGPGSVKANPRKQHLFNPDDGARHQRNPQRQHRGRDGRAVKIRFSRDRKSTRLNSSHVKISYAVFC